MIPNRDKCLPPGLNWDPAISRQAQADDCLRRTDWETLCNIASHAKREVPCKMLHSYTLGGSFLARLLKFQDGTYWVARVQLRKSTPEISRKLRIEIDTTVMLKTETKAPVPQIFAFELDDANSTGSAFVLLEYLPGNNAADEAHGYKKIDWGLIPLQHRHTFYRTMAAAHVQIASARLLKIGTVIRNVDSSFTVGPIPGIRGPFDTAASFIQEWATRVKFPYDESYLQEVLPPLLASDGKQFTRKGPFPIRHNDLFHSNVIVTKDYGVLGVIDWENSYAVPWELINAPWFLNTVPRLLNRPDQYDNAGRPLAKDEAGQWADEEAYADLVREAELDARTDHKLSQILSNRNSRAMAAIIHLFSQGKMGFYGRVLDYFEAK
ncbi:protein kinase-like domain protein [Colletotrichum tofieldiae]|uniref:Protein kinase-like domain protein n=1 Tax=Colletotrichum tofieldiae TaxID=708197 RepID=A0A166XDY9_9PEZI|nr:protein kinase-like domain protein [Colletotrichum tofieldiae]